MLKTKISSVARMNDGVAMPSTETKVAP
jgi:hypothetical protein